MENVAPLPQRRLFSLWLLAGLSLLLAWPTVVRADEHEDLPPVEPSTLRSIWATTLGSEGPLMVDQVIEHYTPECLRPATESELVEQAQTLRSLVIAAMELDLERRPLSEQVQRTHDMEGYAIDVVRLEVFPRLYLPVNVYFPQDATAGSSPLVLLMPGCGSGVYDAYLQVEAYNLVQRGMVVVVIEGFCSNGSRANLENNDYVDYGGEMLGLPGVVLELYLQELITTITWAQERYAMVDPERIGIHGYSYGGLMGMILPTVDQRIRTVSVPATYMGEDCDAFALKYDIYLEPRPFVRLAPWRLPVLPVNWRIPLLYPRPLHTTAGLHDHTLQPNFPDKVMEYAASLYRLGGYEDRLLLQVDSGPHHLDRSRRQNSYAWLVHTLLDQPLAPITETLLITRMADSQLAVDIEGTTTIAQLVADKAAIEQAKRFRSDQSVIATVAEIQAAVQDLFPAFETPNLVRTAVWQRKVGDVSVQAYRVDHPAYAFPVFVFENQAQAEGTKALFLPARGTYQELEAVVQLLTGYRLVISVDVLGIGEVRSSNLMLNTFAHYFMHNTPSVPRLNIELVQGYLRVFESEPVDLVASDWATSIYGLLLKWLEPTRIGAVTVNGVPMDELSYLASGQRVPDLLLWGGLLARVSGKELAATLPADFELRINDGALDTTSMDTHVRFHPNQLSLKPEYVQLSNDREAWATVTYTVSQVGAFWQIKPVTETAVVYARMVDPFGNISSIVSDTIHVIDAGNLATGVIISDNMLYVNSETVTLTVNAPAHTAAMALWDSTELGASLPPKGQEPKWEPYTYQRQWTFSAGRDNGPNRTVYVQFRDVFGNASQIYFDEVIIDQRAPTGTLALEKITDEGELILRIDAFDEVSGVVAMRIKRDTDPDAPAWEPYAPLWVYPLDPDSLLSDEQFVTFCISFQDRAGNTSTQICNQLDLVQPREVYLPLISR